MYFNSLHPKAIFIKNTLEAFTFTKHNSRTWKNKANTAIHQKSEAVAEHSHILPRRSLSKYGALQVDAIDGKQGANS